MSECGEEEEHVEEEFELMVEYFGDEGEQVVLGVFDEVVLVVGGEHAAAEGDAATRDLHLLQEVLLQATQGRGGGGGVLFGTVQQQLLVERGGVVRVHFLFAARLILHRSLLIINLMNRQWLRGAGLEGIWVEG